MHATNQNILSEKRRGNLFINLFGTLDHNSAIEIKDSIKLHYNGSGNIFFNVEKIKKLQEAPVGRRLLADVLADCCLSPSKFFLIGKEGLAIGPQGCRVIVRRKKKCCGKCKNCN